VYSDGRCVWTGELQPGGGEGALSGAELAPSAVIPLVPPKDSSKSNPPPAAVKAQPINPPPLAPATTAVAPVQITKAEAPAADREEASEQRQAAARGRRRSSDAVPDVPPLAGRGTDVDAKSRPRRGRREPPRGLSAVAEDDDWLEDSFQSVDLIAEQKNEREKRIRQSLEAIQRVERYNLGRLRSSGGSFTDYSDSLEQMAGPFPPKAVESVAQDESRLPQGVRNECVDDSLDNTVNSAVSIDAVASTIGGNSTEYSLSLGTTEAQPALPTLQSQKPLRVEAAPQHIQQKQRSQRIDQVQQTIQNTIADLAGIMSSLSIADRQRPKAPVSLTAEALPSGTVLRIEILSTWGDTNYVGLNGLELFDQLGRLCVLTSRAADERCSRCIASVHSFPSDINCLSQFGGPPDPRAVTNLLDGCNFTRSDLHVWLAPHRKALEDFITSDSDLQEKETHLDRQTRSTGDMLRFEDESDALRILRGRGLSVAQDGIAVVVVQFTEPTALCMARLFNYNKSRTHNQRGVRHCRIFLDERNIFTGELRKATGQLITLDAESECIEFCDGHAVIQAARRLSDNLNCKAQEEDDILEESILTMAFNRPRTSQALPFQPIEAHSRDNSINTAALPATITHAPKITSFVVDDVEFINERRNVQTQQLMKPPSPVLERLEFQDGHVE